MFLNSMAGANHATVDDRHSKCQKAETDRLKHNIPVIKESYETVVVTIRHLLMATKRPQRQA